MPHLAYLGRKEGNLLSESSPRSWYLVEIVPIHSNGIIYTIFRCVKCLENFTDTHISLSHTVHNREIWGICKRYVGGLYACFSPPIPHQAPGIGGRPTDRLVPQIPHPLGPSALLSTLSAFPIASLSQPIYSSLFKFMKATTNFSNSSFHLIKPPDREAYWKAIYDSSR